MVGLSVLRPELIQHEAVYLYGLESVHRLKQFESKEKEHFI